MQDLCVSTFDDGRPPFNARFSRHMNVPQATANPVILVTGATRDIGLAAASMLAHRGTTVIIGSAARDQRMPPAAAEFVFPSGAIRV